MAQTANKKKQQPAIDRYNRLTLVKQRLTWLYYHGEQTNNQEGSRETTKKKRLTSSLSIVFMQKATWRTAAPSASPRVGTTQIYLDSTTFEKPTQ